MRLLQRNRSALPSPESNRPGRTLKGHGTAFHVASNGQHPFTDLLFYLQTSWIDTTLTLNSESWSNRAFWTLSPIHPPSKQPQAFPPKGGPWDVQRWAAAFRWSTDH